MTTKTVVLWCDLCPGWQDRDLAASVWLDQNPLVYKLPGNKRFKITVELPCFGGSAEFDGTVTGKVELHEDSQTSDPGGAEAFRGACAP